MVENIFNEKCQNLIQSLVRQGCTVEHTTAILVYNDS